MAIRRPTFAEVLAVSRAKGKSSKAPSLWNGLQALYTGIQGGGGVWMDVSGNGHRGTLDAGVTWSNGGVTTDQEGEKVALAGLSTRMNGWSQLTAVAIINIASQGVGTEYGRTFATATNTEAELFFGNTLGRYYGRVNGTAFGGSTNFPAGKFDVDTMVALRWVAGETDGAQLWIDGVQSDSATVAGTITLAGDAYVGNLAAADRTQDGTTKFLGVWDYGFTASQMRAIYANPYALITMPDNIALWAVATAGAAPAAKSWYYYQRNKMRRAC